MFPLKRDDLENGHESLPCGNENPLSCGEKIDSGRVSYLGYDVMVVDDGDTLAGLEINIKLKIHDDEIKHP